MRRALASAVCIVLLVIAQSGALTHALWHVLGEASAHNSGLTHVAADDAAAHDDRLHDGELPAGQAALCAFDLAFGQVLGAAPGGGLIALPVVSAAAAIADVPSSHLRAEALSPKSRGPPPLV